MNSMTAKSKICIALLIGAFVGSFATYEALSIVRQQEFSLYVKYLGDSSNLRRNVLIMNSYRTRGENLSLAQFLNCTTRSDVKANSLALELQVPQYRLASDAKEFVSERISASIDAAQKALDRDSENSCPEEVL